MKRLLKITAIASIITGTSLLHQNAWCQTDIDDIAVKDTRLIGQQFKQYEDILYHNRQLDQHYRIIKIELRQLENRRRIDQLEQQLEELRYQTD